MEDLNADSDDKDGGAPRRRLERLAARSPPAAVHLHSPPGQSRSRLQARRLGALSYIADDKDGAPLSDDSDD